MNLCILLILTILNIITSEKSTTFNVKDFGAKGDGKTLDTTAIENTFSAAEKAGGGIVLFPSGGKYLTGAFNLTSDTDVVIEKNATILGVEDKGKYPIIAPLPSYGKSRDVGYTRYQPLLFGVHLKNIKIYGGGTINGQGEYWWNLHHEKTLKSGRPRLVEFLWSQNIEMYDLLLENSGFWTLHPVYCENVNIHDLTIRAPSDSPNTDGIDPDSSANVLIERVDISNGDDWIAIKSGMDEAGLEYNWPTRNVTVRDCHFNSRGAIAIGSETSGGVYDIFVYNNVIPDASECLRLKTGRGRGGVIQNIQYKNMVGMKDTILQIDMYYTHIPPTHNTTTTPVIKDVIYSNISATSNGAPRSQENEVTDVDFNCLPESPCTGIQMEHVHLKSSGKQECQNAFGTQVDVVPKTCLKTK